MSNHAIISMGCIKIFISSATTLPATIGTAPAPSHFNDLSAAPITGNQVFLAKFHAGSLLVTALANVTQYSHLQIVIVHMFGVSIIYPELMFGQEKNKSPSPVPRRASIVNFGLVTKLVIWKGITSPAL